MIKTLCPFVQRETANLESSSRLCVDVWLDEPVVEHGLDEPDDGQRLQVAHVVLRGLPEAGRGGFRSWRALLHCNRLLDSRGEGVLS